MAYIVQQIVYGSGVKRMEGIGEIGMEGGNSSGDWLRASHAVS